MIVAGQNPKAHAANWRGKARLIACDYPLDARQDVDQFYTAVWDQFDFYDMSRLLAKM